MTGKHYLLVEVNIGTVKNPVTARSYFELNEPDETVEEALARWIACHPDMIERVRNRDKTEARIRSDIELVRICHPTSWHREKAEAEGRPFPSPPNGGRRRKTVRA